jgi:hypothetical protein
MDRDRSRLRSELNQLGKKLRAEDIDQQVRKSVQINFLVSPAEKVEIRTTAKMLGLTVTDYLIRLHRLTLSLMTPHRRNRVN